MWRSRTPAGGRCAHFPSVITTIMDHKLQLLKPLNKRELYMPGSRTELLHLLGTENSYTVVQMNMSSPRRLHRWFSLTFFACE
jgi:hypothetical protein